MNTEEIKNQIHEEIIKRQFAEFAEVDPIVESGHSESKLRALRRSRAIITAAIKEEIPVEHRLIYQLKADADVPFDRTVEVVTDDAGNILYVVESK